MTHCNESCPRSTAVTPAGLTEAVVQTVRQWLHNQRLRAAIQRERALLLTMSDSMLKDIGINRSSAEQEARRKDIPAIRKS